MDTSHMSDQTKEFLQSVISSGEKWLGEEVKALFESSENEKDFLDDTTLYLTRIEIKVRQLKEQSEKISGLV
jgi:hypothetical protein